MGLGLVGQATAMFAVTNVDDLVLLSLFFAQATGFRGAATRVVIGQYLGFLGLVTISAAGALGVGLLPTGAVPYLGVIPLALGLRAGWRAWRDQASDGDDTPKPTEVTVWTIAGITFANGGDNIGVYVPVFAAASPGEMIVFITVFLVLVGLWCLAGRFLATRPLVASALARWGHLVLPLVLIGIGLAILVEGGAFGL